MIDVWDHIKVIPHDTPLCHSEFIFVDLLFPNNRKITLKRKIPKKAVPTMISATPISPLIRKEPQVMYLIHRFPMTTEVIL